jgi:hypothetical protein
MAFACVYVLKMRRKLGKTRRQASPDEISHRKAALAEFQKLMVDLPVESPEDGFSGTEHDQLLYGSP